MYLRGEGVARDMEQGLRLLRLAAGWGDAIAAYNLGALHRSGADGVPRDAGANGLYFLMARDLGCKLPVDDYLD
jgi:TPR repeat protein